MSKESKKYGCTEGVGRISGTDTESELALKSRVLRENFSTADSTDTPELWKHLYGRLPFCELRLVSPNQLSVTLGKGTVVVPTQVFWDRDKFNEYAWGKIGCSPICVMTMSPQRWRCMAVRLLQYLERE
jgi:hypothetical protein